MISRRRFVAATALAPVAAFAQRPGKLPVVAYVFGPVTSSVMAGPVPAHLHVRAFVHRLRELGWQDGRNVVIERHGAENRREHAQAILADLAARNVAVIYAAATAGDGLVAKDALLATRTIPIVFAGSSDPVSDGLVTSLGRPGGNATGVTVSAGRDIHGKRLELLKEIAPGAKRVAYFDPMSVTAEHVLQAGARIGLTLIHAKVERTEQYDAAFATAMKARADAMLVGAFSVHHVNAARTVEFAARHRLPAVYAFPEMVAAGGLASYSIDFLDLNRRAAEYVNRILRGAKPADMPVAQPTKFELIVNLKTARALGITIPQSVLLRADRVIE